MADLWMMRTVAAALFLILFTMIIVLCFVEVPKANHDILLTLTSLIGGAAMTVVSFFFGSSNSSRSKDETIKQIVTETRGGA